MDDQEAVSSQQDDSHFVPECEIAFEGGPNTQELFETCTKNPGHLTFIPVKEFDIDRRLPPERRTDAMRNHIKDMFNRTVKISVKYTSLSRPDVYPDTTAPYFYSDMKGNDEFERLGTGFIVSYPVREKNKPCPCPQCKGSGNPKMEYLLMYVKTAAHVVFDDSESETVVCDLFYDSEDKEGVQCIYGITGENPEGVDVVTRCRDDVVYVPCVTHDMDLMEPFNRESFSSERVPFPLIISHPHGGSKRVTVGTYCRMRAHLPANYSSCIPLRFGPGLICRLTENAKPLTMNYLRQITNGSPEAGVEYNLQGEMSLHLPQDAEYLCQSLISKEQWVQFHPRTRFIYGNSRKSIKLPDVEFNISSAARDFYADGKIPFHMAYDADTCPGSSGAKVMYDGNSPGVRYLFPTHSGALKGSMNGSGQWVFPPFLR